MFEESFDVFHFFVFIIPGFVTVWTYRYFSNAGKIGEFEYFASSCFWGLLILGIYEWIAPKEVTEQLLSNPYAAGGALSLLGFFFGVFSPWVFGSSKFVKLMNWIKTHIFLR